MGSVYVKPSITAQPSIPTSLHLVLLAADVYDSNHMYYGRAMGGEKVSPA